MADYRNSENYADPTAFAALCEIEKAEKAEEKEIRKFRPLVYICSPYAGDIVLNTENARRYSKYAVDSGCIPVTPHLLFPQFLDENNPNERKLGLHFGNVLQDKCSAVWVFGEYISEGMKAEIERAKRERQKIRYFNEDLEEIHKWK